MSVLTKKQRRNVELGSIGIKKIFLSQISLSQVESVATILELRKEQLSVERQPFELLPTSEKFVR